MQNRPNFRFPTNTIPESDSEGQEDLRRDVPCRASRGKKEGQESSPIPRFSGVHEKSHLQDQINQHRLSWFGFNQLMINNFGISLLQFRFKIKKVDRKVNPINR